MALILPNPLTPPPTPTGISYQSQSNTHFTQNTAISHPTYIKHIHRWVFWLHIPQTPLFPLVFFFIKHFRKKSSFLKVNGLVRVHTRIVLKFVKVSTFKSLGSDLSSLKRCELWFEFPLCFRNPRIFWCKSLDFSQIIHPYLTKSANLRLILVFRGISPDFCNKSYGL